MASEPKMLADLRRIVERVDTTDGFDEGLIVDFIADHGPALLARLEAVEAAVLAEREAKDAAYTERNRLALLLAAKLGGCIQAASDASPGWCHVVLFNTGCGQASFHIPDSEDEYALQCDVPFGTMEWDGHTNDEKWARIAKASGISARTRREGRGEAATGAEGREG